MKEIYETLKYARGVLFIARNRLVSFGKPTKQEDKMLNKIDKTLEKYSEQEGQISDP